MRRVLALKQPDDVQNDAVKHRGRDAENEHRAGNDEHFCAETGHKALAFEFQRGGDHRVCKAGDRHERARARVLCDVVIHAEGGQRRGEKNQRDGNKGARVPQREAEQHEEVCDALPECADCAAE